LKEDQRAGENNEMQEFKILMKEENFKNKIRKTDRNQEE
jgi:hypothetical protein